MKVPTPFEGFVTGNVRVWLRAEGLTAFLLSLLFYRHLGSRWWVFFALFLVPDLSMLGYLVNARVGAICYNVVHSYFLPLGIAGAAVASNRMNMIPLLCVWIAHIGLDRLLGYGLKYPTAFSTTHLGRLGKVSS